MKLKQLINKRDQLRIKWIKFRKKKLNQKNFLIRKGNNILEIRKDPEYKKMKKEQKKISTEIKHVEKKINKLRARLSEKK